MDSKRANKQNGKLETEQSGQQLQISYKGVFSFPLTFHKNGLDSRKGKTETGEKYAHDNLEFINDGLIPIPDFHFFFNKSIIHSPDDIIAENSTIYEWLILMIPNLITIHLGFFDSLIM